MTRQPPPSRVGSEPVVTAGPVFPPPQRPSGAARAPRTRAFRTVVAWGLLLVIIDQPVATLRIANIPNETTEIEIRALFAPYSMTKRVRLILATPARRSRGFGFIDVKPSEVADTIAALDGSVFRGAVIRLNDVSRRQPSATIVRHRDAVLRKDTTAPDPAARFHYELASVERAVTPAGGQGADWCRYVLSCGSSRITGLHNGTVEEVTAYATSCAEAFNDRSAKGRSRNPVVFGRK